MNSNCQNSFQINSDFNNLNNYNNINSPNYSLYRSNTSSKGKPKKLNFKSMKNNTITSLNDVEHFLNNIHHAFRYIKLYKLLK